jgi:16S rRNA (uracil1498-N3)-methyltransferase
MPRFFLQKEFLTGTSALLTGKAAHHISFSLRMAVGDSLTLCDGEGYEYLGTILHMNGEEVEVGLQSCQKCQSEPFYRAILYQAVAKGEKMDFIVQKAVEYGIFEIVPVESERCIVRLDRSSAEKKRERWQKIADEAAGQCGRGILPRVHSPLSFEEALDRMVGADLSFLCYEGEKTRSLSSILNGNPQTIAFFVGPEGGISPREVLLASQKNISLCTLGNRILRTESASGFVLSCLSFRYEMG